MLLDGEDGISKTGKISQSLTEPQVQLRVFLLRVKRNHHDVVMYDVIQRMSPLVHFKITLVILFRKVVNKKCAI